MSAHSITSRGLAGRKIPQGTLTAMGALLFGASEPGTWYDPSDMSTLFQDSAGTVPVTAVEQPVGLMLDKRLGLVRGVEKVANGGFDTSAGWTLGTGWSIGGGVATFDPTGQTANSDAYASLSSASDSAATYDITVNGAFRVMLPISAGGIVEISGTVLNRTAGALRVLSAVGRIYIRALNGTGFNGSVENISVRELPGNHASQATTTKRPVYSRRVNLLTKTEQFSDAVWAKNNGTTVSGRKVISGTTSGYQGINHSIVVAVGHEYITKCKVKAAEYTRVTISDGAFSRFSATFNLTTGVVTESRGDGFVSATITSAGSGEFVIAVRSTFTQTTYYARFSGNPANTSFAAGAYFAGDGVSGVEVWDVGVTLATDAHFPYQWVNTATDYDADPAKFPAYLCFDGVDDALQTGNIDFTSTDKMTVWAGVTPLLVGGNQWVAASTPTTGRFSLISESFGFSQFESRGSSASYAAAAALLMSGQVLSGRGDISGDVAVLRRNGVQVASNPSDQGTGNYGNGLLIIGGLTVSLNHFNGRLYSLIVRGAQTPLSQIEATELYIKQKMRMP